MSAPIIMMPDELTTDCSDPVMCCVECAMYGCAKEHAAKIEKELSDPKCLVAEFGPSIEPRRE